MDIEQEMLLYTYKMRRMLNVNYVYRDKVLDLFKHLDSTIRNIHRLPYDVVDETINKLLSMIGDYSRPMPGMETEYGQYRRLLKAVAREAMGRMAQETTEIQQVRMGVPKEYEDNPSSCRLPAGVTEQQLDNAVEVYDKFHDFPPTKIESITIPQPKVLTKLGTFSAIGYHSAKWKNKKKLKQKYAGTYGQQYIHEFKKWPKGKPGVVMFSPDKNNPEYGIIIAIGKCRVTPHGIEDIK